MNKILVLTLTKNDSDLSVMKKAAEAINSRGKIGRSSRWSDCITHDIDSDWRSS